MQTSASVSKLTITSLAPTVEKKYAHLVPTKLVPVHAEFTLTNVSGAVANGIRRTIGGEMIIKAMDVECSNISTTDRFIIQEMVKARLRLIPIDQSTPETATFHLEVSNPSPLLIDVKSSAIKARDNKVTPFNDTFTICTLNPGKHLKIGPITIKSQYGIIDRHAGHTIAINTVALPLDQTPINRFEPSSTGITSSISNPRVWKVAFNTNGGMPPVAIISLACDTIIAKLKNLIAILHTITSVEHIHTLIINQESDTIGCLVMKTATELFPDIHSVTYTVDTFVNILTIRVNYPAVDIEIFYKTIVNHLVELFSLIRNSVS